MTLQVTLFKKKQANLQLNAVLIIRLDQDIAYLWKLFVRRDHLILAARNSRHELWDHNRFTNTWHLEPVNVSKHHILGPKTNQTDWRQPFNVFRSQISFLFCSKIIYLFRSISLRNMCNQFVYHFDVAGESSVNQTLQLLYLLKWSSRSVKWRKTCDFVPVVLFWVFVFSSDGWNQ